MLHTLTLLSLLGAPLIAAAGACTGADPALTSAKVESSAQNGELRHYVVSVTVTNLGNQKQPSNLLQSVEIFQNETHVGQKGVKPLAPHGSTTIRYAFDRSVQANDGSTDLRFHLKLDNMPQPGLLDCNPNNDTYEMHV